MSYHTVMRQTGEAEIGEGSGGSAVVTLPIQVKPRGERKQIIAPDGQSRQRVEITPMQQALLRGYRWL
ncbi:hypothetical protein D5085_07795 [Ectothiorhodospiraceae bacterium BW-2]|nr:hypothetical protein D5085_07795 [Ectothiorhodospiraceae bacterium BW-2]